MSLFVHKLWLVELVNFVCSFAFVALEDANDKDKASALNGEMLDGNALKIDLAGNKPKRDATSGR